MPESAYSFFGHEFEVEMKVFTLRETPSFLLRQELKMTIASGSWKT